jgi:hypothetical protein
MINLNIGDSALTYFVLPRHEPDHVAFRVTLRVLAVAIELSALFAVQLM